MPLLLPFFKFDVQAWLTSETVMLMNNEQRGAFIQLLAKCWACLSCTLPNDVEKVKALADWKGSEEDFTRVFLCFIPDKKHPERRLNERLMKEWKEAKLKQAFYAERAKAGADARWAEKPARTPTVNNGRNYVAESKEVLTFLNEKTHKQFRAVDATLAPIQARLKSGIDVQTCRTLIMRKVHDWLADEKMTKFLRPETLFNKTKFEGYLAEVTK